MQQRETSTAGRAKAAAFAEQIQRWCETGESLKLLRVTPEDASLTWQDGGCGILARAINEIHPSAQTFGVFGTYGNETEPSMWHAFTGMDGVFFDGNGWYDEPSADAFARQWAAHHEITFRECVEINCQQWVPRESPSFQTMVAPVAEAIRVWTTEPAFPDELIVDRGDVAEAIRHAEPSTRRPDLGASIEV